MLQINGHRNSSHSASLNARSGSKRATADNTCVSQETQSLSTTQATPCCPVFCRLRLPSGESQKSGIGNFTRQDSDFCPRTFCADSSSAQNSSIIMVILHGQRIFSANVRNSPQHFHKHCTDKCQNHGLQNSLVVGGDTSCGQSTKLSLDFTGFVRLDHILNIKGRNS